MVAYFASVDSHFAAIVAYPAAAFVSNLALMIAYFCCSSCLISCSSDSLPSSSGLAFLSNGRLSCSCICMYLVWHQGLLISKQQPLILQHAMVALVIINVAETLIIFGRSMFACTKKFIVYTLDKVALI